MDFRKHFESDMARLSLWAPVALGLGIAVYFALPHQPGHWLLPCIALGLVLLLAAARRMVTLRWPVYAVMLLLAGVGLADAATRFSGTPMLQRDSAVRTVTGIVHNIEPQERGARVVLSNVTVQKLYAAQTPVRIRLTYKLKEPLPPIGAQVSCDVKLLAISPPVLPGGYDFRRHNYFERIGATGFAIAPCTVLSLSPPQPLLQGMTHGMAAGRHQLRGMIDAKLDGDVAAITEALLTGVQQGITEPTMEAMRVSGLVHILSVSGMHIGLAAGIVFFVLRALLALVPFVALRWPIKKIAAAAAFLSALAYTLFVGAPIPAVRSMLMTGLMLLAVMLDRPALSLRVVAVAALGVLVVYPHSLLSPSFQLSFAAVTAIIAAFEASEGWRTRWLAQQPWLLRAAVWVLAIAGTSLVATLATLPFTYYHFQQLNLYGVLANMLAGPLTSFWLMPMAILTFMAAPFGLQDWPLHIMGQGVVVLIAIAKSVAALPGADLRASYLPTSGLALFALGGLWLLLWQARWRWLGLLPMALAVVIGLSVQLPSALVSDDGKVAMLRADDNNFVLVAGKRLRADNFVVEQWRRHLGVRQVARAEDTPHCTDAVCVTGSLVLVRDGNAMADWCNQTDKILLLPTSSAGTKCGVTVDNWNLYRTGAVTINGQGRVHTVAERVGKWPWSAFTR